MAHHAVVDPNHKSGFWASKPGYKPILLLIAAIVFTGLVVIPPPQSMIDIAGKQRVPGYKLSSGCNTITDSINKKLRPAAFKAEKQPDKAAHEESEPLFTDRDAARLAKIMLAIFALAVFLWGTEALPLGATDLLVGVMLYLF
jgi:sodium-dependent dicarboxylate transporter 2/3/5